MENFVPSNPARILVSALEIASINPLDHASDIKELFVTHDRPEFPQFFDRAYPAAVRVGARSWVGLDSDGRLVMHIARFSHRFAMGEDTLVAGILVNLMVAKSHRTFLPAAALLRRVVADSKEQQGVDFLYVDSVPAASVVLKAAGFSVLGTLGRFAFPLGARQWYADTLARLYQLTVRTRTGSGGYEMIKHSARGFDTAPFERPTGSSVMLRPFRPAELYARRIEGYPSDKDHWFTIRKGPESSPPAGAVLIREFPNGIAKLISLSREPSMSLSDSTASLIGALREADYKRLWVSTLLESEFARDLNRAGFIARRDTSPLLAYGLTKRGAGAIRSPEKWEITDLDCDRGDPLAA
jgi:hypothetical protein